MLSFDSSIDKFFQDGYEIREIYNVLKEFSEGAAPVLSLPI